MIFSKIYKYDQQSLQQIKISKARIILHWAIFALIGFACGVGISYLFKPKKEKSEPTYEELVIMVDAAENELASPKAIYLYMKEIGIKYPEIVWSQVVLESRFSSQVCIENHNYFGMKRAACRANFQTGENLGHATYRNWKTSVMDYALWQASTGVWKLKDEASYFNYLDQRYAEGANYALKVKEIRDSFEYYLDLYEEKFKKEELK